METEVQKIHRKFNTASDKYKNIKQKTSSSRCAAVGFTNVDRDVVKQSTVDYQKSEIVRKYAIKYPGNKFIFSEDVTRINKKYNLVIDMAFYYKGSIPESNLSEIERFAKNHNMTTPGPSWADRMIKNWPYLIDGMTLYILAVILFVHLPYFLLSDYLLPRGGVLIPKDDMVFNLTFIISIVALFFNFLNERSHSTFRMIFKNNIKKTLQNNFLICAPAKDFTQYHYAENNPIKDPIVLKAVEFDVIKRGAQKGNVRPTGYIIVTAWGDESKEENIFNERNN